MLQIGRWYRWGANPPGLKGKPIRVVGVKDNGLYTGRWLNSHETVFFEQDISAAIPEDDAPIPGRTEPCGYCNDKRMVSIFEARTDEPWVLDTVGAAPCPHCARPDPPRPIAVALAPIGQIPR